MPNFMTNDTIWQCSVCGGVNHAGGFCSICGDRVSPPDAGPGNRSAERRPAAEHPQSPPVPPAQVSLGFGRKAWTGVVRDIQIRPLDPTVRFRLAMPRQAEEPERHLTVEIDASTQPIYVQDGDAVTLIGRSGRASTLRNPVLLNHACTCSMAPAEPPLLDFDQTWRGHSTMWWFLVLWLPASMPGVLNMLFPSFGAAVGTKFLLPLTYVLIMPGFAFLYYIAGRRIWWVLTGGLLKRREIRSLVAGLGDAWQPRKLRDCSGTVEGVFVFFRGRRNPVEWVSFCLVTEPSEVTGRRRLLGAIPRSELPASLRGGEALFWRGEAMTGLIHPRPDLRFPML
jgi:hypothetical protein